MAEEELQLRVVLVDEASIKIRNIRNELMRLGGGPAGVGMDRLRNQSRDLMNIMRPLATGTIPVNQGMRLMNQQFAATGVVVAGMAYALYNGLRHLNEYAKGLEEVNYQALALGVTGAQFNNLERQLTRMGYTSQQARQFITSYIRAITEMQEEGSQLYERMMRGGWQNPDAMQQLYERMIGTANRGEWAASINEFAQATQNIIDNETANFRNRNQGQLMAAGAAREWFEAFRMDPTANTRLRADLQDITEVQEREFNQRLQQAQTYADLIRGMQASLSQFYEGFVGGVIGPFSEILGKFNLNEERIKKWGQAIGGEIGKAIGEVIKLTREVSNLVIQVRKLRDEGVPTMEAVAQALQMEPSALNWIAAGAGAGAGVGLTVGGIGALPGAIVGAAGGYAAYRRTRQEGGQIDAGPYLVGERGPELYLPGGGAAGPQIVGANGPEIFTPPASGTILPNTNVGEQVAEPAASGPGWQKEAIKWGAWGAAKGAALYGLPGAEAAAQTVYGASRAMQIGEAATSAEAVSEVGKLGLAYALGAAGTGPTALWVGVFKAMQWQRKWIQESQEMLKRGEKPGILRQQDYETLRRGKSAIRGALGSIIGRQLGGPVAGLGGGPVGGYITGMGGQRNLGEQLYLNTESINDLTEQTETSSEEIRRLSDLIEPVVGVGARAGGGELGGAAALAMLLGLVRRGGRGAASTAGGIGAISGGGGTAGAGGNAFVGGGGTAGGGGATGAFEGAAAGGPSGGATEAAGGPAETGAGTPPSGQAGSQPKGASEISSRLMGDLQRDFGLSREQAAGMVGNLRHETGNFRLMQEKRPIVPGSRGGYGYAQWTGPRRRQFEAWAQKQGLNVNSYEANYGFLKHELQTSERKTVNALKRTQSVGQAAMAAERSFFRAGIKHNERRLREAQNVYAAKAEGGNVEAGRPILVGEKGPEVVDVGSGRSEIVGQGGPELITPRASGTIDTDISKTLGLSGPLREETKGLVVHHNIARGNMDLQRTAVAQLAVMLERQFGYDPRQSTQIGMWQSMPGTAGGNQYLPDDVRGEINRSLGTQSRNMIESNATLKVNVNAPNGTRVTAEGEGVFSKTELNRQIAMA